MSIKVYTLRGIFILPTALFFAACSNNAQYKNSNTIGEVKTISSEDKYYAVTQIGEIKEPEYGQTVYVVQKK